MWIIEVTCYCSADEDLSAYTGSADPRALPMVSPFEATELSVEC